MGSILGPILSFLNLERDFRDPQFLPPGPQPECKPALSYFSRVLASLGDSPMSLFGDFGPFVFILKRMHYSSCSDDNHSSVRAPEKSWKTERLRQSAISEKGTENTTVAPAFACNSRNLQLGQYDETPQLLQQQDVGFFPTEMDLRYVTELILQRT